MFFEATAVAISLSWISAAAASLSAASGFLSASSQMRL